MTVALNSPIVNREKPYAKSRVVFAGWLRRWSCVRFINQFLARFGNQIKQRTIRLRRVQRAQTNWSEPLSSGSGRVISDPEVGQPAGEQFLRRVQAQSLRMCGRPLGTYKRRSFRISHDLTQRQHRSHFRTPELTASVCKLMTSQRWRG